LAGERLKEADHVKYIGADERIILKTIFKKHFGRNV
jgi:hypothetical protein